MRIRLMTQDDVEAVVGVWHRSGLKAYYFIDLWQQLTLTEARRLFREHVAALCEVWVAETDAEIVGFLARRGSYIDRLYINPDHQRVGVGQALLAHAMRCSPSGLELHTHRKNAPARAFYEKHGFVAVRYGISPPPESEPDVEYHWRPAGRD